MTDDGAEAAMPLEVSEADLAEQRTPITPGEDGDPARSAPSTTDADEADVLDQSRPLSADDEDYPGRGDQAG